MTEKMNWLAERWVERLGPAISAMTGERSSARFADGLPVSRSGDRSFCGQIEFDVAAGAKLSVVIAESAWSAIGKSVLAAAGIADAQADELESTFLEVLQQSLAPLGQALSPLIGREAAAGKLDRTREPGAFSDWAGVVIELGGVSIGEGWISVSPELQNVLRLPGKPKETEAEEQRIAPPRGAAGGRNSKTLDLLLEVELPVGVSFGRTQMRLKDAIKLSTGSIVELNRTITEPVEIIVNNCVIARGEVVVVEGNYGVRIKEIISREERLRTLF